MSIFIKDPDAVLDYGFNWEDWLAVGETITESVWTIPTGLTKDSDSFSGTATTVWLSGGVEDAEYVIVNHIVTTGGREDDRSHTIKMKSR